MVTSFIIEIDFVAKKLNLFPTLMKHLNDENQFSLETIQNMMFSCKILKYSFKKNTLKLNSVSCITFSSIKKKIIAQLVNY